MAEETPTSQPPKSAKSEQAAVAKKTKEPALEDKPFTEFIEQHFTPSLQTALTQAGLTDIHLQFQKQKIPVSGLEDKGDCWQVLGNWSGSKRQFRIYFLDDSIGGAKAFSWAMGGNPPSTLESFMIDERKVTLDLMVNYTLQRLNGQKWLTRN